MLRRSLSKLAKVAEGVITGVSCRPVYLQKADLTKYMHEYVLDNDKSYVLQWCKEDLCAFQEGDRVRLHYDVKTDAGFDREDHVIVRNSMRLLQGESMATTAKYTQVVTQESERATSHSPLPTTAARSSACSNALSHDQVLRCQMLDVVKALMVAKVANDVSMPMEALTVELVQAARVLEKFVLSGEGSPAKVAVLPQLEATTEIPESKPADGVATQELQGSEGGRIALQLPQEQQQQQQVAP